MRDGVGKISPNVSFRTQIYSAFPQLLLDIRVKSDVHEAMDRVRLENALN